MSRSSAEAARRATGAAIYKEILGRCLKDSNGNPYTTCSLIYSFMIKLTVIAFCASAAVLLAMSLFSSKSGDITLVLCLVIGGGVFMVLFVFVMRMRFKGTYTLLPDALKVDTPSLKGTFSYSEIKKWAEQYPPIEYKYLYILVVDNKLIKLNFSALMGSVDFITLLCYNSDIPAPDTDAMTKKIKQGFVSATEEEKAAYHTYKKLHK